MPGKVLRLSGGEIQKCVRWSHPHTIVGVTDGQMTTNTTHAEWSMDTEWNGNRRNEFWLGGLTGLWRKR